MPLSPDAPLSWADISSRHPPDFFSTRAGQARWAAEYAGKVLARPAAWSLPGELGPWPKDEDDVIVRILSLIPGCSAAIIGDFLYGTWLIRSTAYEEAGTTALIRLKALGQVTTRPLEWWWGWYAVTPVVPSIDPNLPLLPPTRGFLNRARLAVIDRQIFPQLAARRKADERHLADLLAVPPSERDDRWTRETEIFREIVAEWSRGGPIPGV